MKRNEYTPEQRRWIEALKSGEYKQGKDQLCTGDAYCCLGVATHLHNPDHLMLEGDEGHLPNDITGLHLFGAAGRIIEGSHNFLTNLNDDGVTFLEIAAIMEKTPWKVFSNFDEP